jgi:hypothetical protein
MKVDSEELDLGCGMSVERAYGVECKNKECHTGIILGSYITRPERGGDLVSFVVVRKEGTVKCPTCGASHEYGQADIREFPNA